MSGHKIRIFLPGSEGQLGRALRQSLPEWAELMAVSRQQLDITDRAAVQTAVSAFRPDWIVNTAAYTAVDRAESECDQAFRVNADGAAHLAEGAAQHGARMVQLSTDYVFDGKAFSPYQPNDTPNPINAYGISKLAGEQRVADILDERALILRTAWVYSLQGPSFLTTMLRLMKERDELCVIEDQVGTPTRAVSLASAVLTAVERGLTGIHHWTDAGVASWYDFACVIREAALGLGMFERAATVVPIKSSYYPSVSRRPL